MSRTLKQLQDDNYQDLTEEEINSSKQIFSILTDAVDIWPNQFRKAYDAFLKHYGWHIRLWMSLDIIIPYIKLGNEAVDNYFIRHLSKSRWKIRKQALKSFPQRKEMINCAFKAHKRRNYLLSIPMFLMLSEGIFRDISGQDLFYKNSNNKKSTYIKNLKNDKKVNSIMSHVIEAAINGDIIGLRFDDGQYLKYPHVLSRNKILHGADVSYGTKTNAYKALSQFEFVIETIYLASSGKEF